MKLVVYKMFDPEGNDKGLTSSLREAAAMVGATYEAIRIAIKHKRKCKGWEIIPITLTPENMLIYDIFNK